MKRLMSTGASRAWLAVALIGLAVIALVFALQLRPRLSAGQALLDDAAPAFDDQRVAGTKAGVDFVSSYVDLVDPLVTARRGAARELPKLVGLIERRGKLTTAQAQRALRRRAPQTLALLRSLPLTRTSAEVPRLTQFLATTLVTTTDDLQATLVQDYPLLAQTLAALRNLTSGWNAVPGVDGRLTRLDGRPVSTTPQLRDFYRDDLVALIDANRGRFQDVAGSGGIGYVPYLLLVVGLIVFSYGVYQARAATRRAPGKLAWSIVVAIGVVIVALVGVLGFVPRLNGADKLLGDLEPAFAQERIDGALAGGDFIHEAVLFGDPIATTRGGARPQLRRLIRFVGGHSALNERQVRRAVRRVAPHIFAAMQAAPLSGIADEVPKLERYLSRTLKLPRGRLAAALQRSAPRIAQSLQAARTVGQGWKSIPGTGSLTRFDGVTPVRSMPAFDDYLRQDLLRVLPDQRADFDRLADGWPPVNLLAPLLAIVGAFVVLYGLLMMRFATPRY